MSRHTILPAAQLLSDGRKASLTATIGRLRRHALEARDERTHGVPLPGLECPVTCGCAELGDCPLIGVSPR